MKYLTISKFYDSGRVSCEIRRCNDDAQEKVEEHSSYDVYVDVFETYEEAKENREDCLNT